MVDKRNNLRRVLAVAGCGAAVVGALFLCNVLKQRMGREKLRAHAGAEHTVYKCDTVNITSKELMQAIVNGDVQAYAGSFDRLQDVVHTYYYKDLTGTDYCREITGIINDAESMTSHHEIRHALNSRYMWRYNKIKGADIFVYDEISARVAECLARLGNEKPLKPGNLSPLVKYKVFEKCNLRDVADIAITQALNEMLGYFHLGVDIFDESAYYSKYDPKMFDVVVDKKTLVDEIMTFDINGKPQNMLKLASKKTRAKVRQYVKMVNDALADKAR